MTVSKFFRRYSRILLMVFMSLLLVVFLIGDQLQTCAERRNELQIQLGTAFGDSVSTRDIESARAKQQLLGRMGFREVQGLDSLNYYLLTQEARRLGVVIGEEQVKQAVQDRLRMQGVDPAQQLRLAQQASNRSYGDMYAAAGEWMAVMQAVSSQAAALGESLPRAETEYRDWRQQAEAQLSVIDAHALAPFVAAPSEAELQAFYEERKGRYTAHTEDDLSFGYQQPDRVQIEYITVRPEELADRVRVRPREREEFFEAHRQNYTKTVTIPTTQPGEAPQQERVPMTYEEAEDQVREDARLDKAVREAQRLVNVLRDEAFNPWRQQPRDEAGFHEPLPEANTVSLEALRDRYAGEAPVRFARSEMLGPDELEGFFDPRPEFFREQLGSEVPMYFEGGMTVPASELALRVAGIYTPTKDDTLPLLQIGEPSPVLLTEKTNRATRQREPYQAYFFRVVAIKPEGPPESLDAVREQVLEDYRLKTAMELAGEYAQQIAARAKEVGLEIAVAEAQELKQRLEQADEQFAPTASFDPEQPPQFAKVLGPYMPSPPLTRARTTVQWVGETTNVPETAFELMDDPGMQEAGAPYPVKAVKVADQFKWVVVQLKEIKPLYAGQFDRRMWMQRGMQPGQQQLQFLFEWIAPDNLYARVDYQPSPEFAER